MFKIIKALHITALEKRMITAMIANNVNSVRSKRVSAVMSNLEGNLRKVVFDNRWIVIIEVK